MELIVALLPQFSVVRFGEVRAPQHHECVRVARHWWQFPRHACRRVLVVELRIARQNLRLLIATEDSSEEDLAESPRR